MFVMKHCIHKYYKLVHRVSSYLYFVVIRSDFTKHQNLTFIMTNCQIKLNNSHLGFFYSGQHLNGTIELQNKKPMICKGKRILIGSRRNLENTFQ